MAAEHPVGLASARRGADVLDSVNSWGFLTLRHAGARPDPAVYQPLPRTFRPLTDESWESDVPACLEPFILFREAVGDVRRSRKGALPSPYDSS